MGSVFQFRQSVWLYSGVKQMASDSVCLAVWFIGICSSWHCNSPWHRLAPLWDGLLLCKQAKFKVLLPVCARQQREAQLLLSRVSFGLTKAHTIFIGDRFDISRWKETWSLGCWIDRFFLYFNDLFLSANSFIYLRSHWHKFHMHMHLYRGYLLQNRVYSCSNYY